MEWQIGRRLISGSQCESGKNTHPSGLCSRRSPSRCVPPNLPAPTLPANQVRKASGVGCSREESVVGEIGLTSKDVRDASSRSTTRLSSSKSGYAVATVSWRPRAGARKRKKESLRDAAGGRDSPVRNDPAQVRCTPACSAGASVTPRAECSPTQHNTAPARVMPAAAAPRRPPFRFTPGSMSFPSVPLLTSGRRETSCWGGGRVGVRPSSVWPFGRGPPEQGQVIRSGASGSCSGWGHLGGGAGTLPAAGKSPSEAGPSCPLRLPPT